MNETTFENARVGDKVEHLVRGKGTITDIIKDSLCPIVVQFEEGAGSYTYDGRFNFMENTRVLFWPGSVTINPQPRPKRKVIKTVERWWVYRGNMEELMFDNARTARACASVHNGRVVHLTGTYEAEE